MVNEISKLLSLLFLILAFAVLTNGQIIRVSGTVYDPTGAVVPSVNIKATDEQGRSNAVKTNDEGAFLIELAPGLFSIIIEKAGFKTLEYKKYRVVNSTYGKMNIDFVIFGSTDHEPCGYGGGECMSTKPIENIEKTKPSNKISTRPKSKKSNNLNN